MTDAIPGWQAARLAVLLDALDGVPLSGQERATLTWLCGFEVETVENLAAVIHRARCRRSSRGGVTAAPMSISQVAERWGKSTRLIRCWCAKGVFPGAFRIGNRWAIPRAAVLLRERTTSETAAGNDPSDSRENSQEM